MVMHWRPKWLNRGTNQGFVPRGTVAASSLLWECRFPLDLVRWTNQGERFESRVWAVSTAVGGSSMRLGSGCVQMILRQSEPSLVIERLQAQFFRFSAWYATIYLHLVWDSESISRAMWNSSTACPCCICFVGNFDPDRAIEIRKFFLTPVRCPIRRLIFLKYLMGTGQ
jgi:hypothetical protein